MCPNVLRPLESRIKKPKGTEKKPWTKKLYTKELWIKKLQDKTHGIKKTRIYFCAKTI